MHTFQTGDKVRYSWGERTLVGTVTGHHPDESPDNGGIYDVKWDGTANELRYYGRDLELVSRKYDVILETEPRK